MNPKLQLALMVTAVTCAVVMTVLVLKREIGSPSSQRDEGVQVDGLAMLIESAPHASGPTDATVTIVEFFDLQCPACRQFSLSMDSVRSSGRHSIRIVRHHYPLTTIHPMAQDLALVGLCLGDSALFDDYYRRAYELQGLLGSRASVGPMQLLPAGTDTTAIRHCVSAPETWDRLAKEIQLGDRLRLRATPSFIIGSRLFTGARSASELSTLISRWGR